MKSNPSTICLLILVAIHGFKREIYLRSNALKSDPLQSPLWIEALRIEEIVRTGGSFTSEYEDILDLMEHTRQLARIPYDEWNKVVILKE